MGAACTVQGVGGEATGVGEAAGEERLCSAREVRSRPAGRRHTMSAMGAERAGQRARVAETREKVSAVRGRQGEWEYEG